MEAAQELLRLTGHDDSKGPWPGWALAFTLHGAMWAWWKAKRAQQVSPPWRNNVNIPARPASQAGAGEILISDPSDSTAGLNFQESEQRQLELKGKSALIGCMFCEWIEVKFTPISKESPWVTL
jgi:hypothetical protein